MNKIKLAVALFLALVLCMAQSTMATENVQIYKRQNVEHASRIRIRNVGSKFRGSNRARLHAIAQKARVHRQSSPMCPAAT